MATHLQEDLASLVENTKANTPKIALDLKTLKVQPMRNLSKTIFLTAAWQPFFRLNPFIPKSDQFQISPAASPEILHHAVRRIWLFIAYLDERWSYYQFSQTRSYISLNPSTPESDQCQNSPAASQEIWHHTVWRSWLFLAYSDEKWLYYKFSLHHSYNPFLKGWKNTLFELRSERVKNVGRMYFLNLGMQGLKH